MTAWLDWSDTNSAQSILICHNWGFEWRIYEFGTIEETLKFSWAPISHTLAIRWIKSRRVSSTFRIRTYIERNLNHWNFYAAVTVKGTLIFSCKVSERIFVSTVQCSVTQPTKIESLMSLHKFTKIWYIREINWYGCLGFRLTIRWENLDISRPLKYDLLCG